MLNFYSTFISIYINTLHVLSRFIGCLKDMPVIRCAWFTNRY